MDHQQAELLQHEAQAEEEQPWLAAAVGGAPHPGSSADDSLLSSIDDGLIFTDAAGVPLGAASSSGSRFAAGAAACRAEAPRRRGGAGGGALAWQPAAGWLGRGRWGRMPGSSVSGSVAARAFLDVSSAYGGSTDSLDDAELAAGSSSSSASRVGGAALNGAVALQQERRPAEQSPASSNGISRNGSSSSNGSSNGSSSNGAAHRPELRSKPQRQAPPPPGGRAGATLDAAEEAAVAAGAPAAEGGSQATTAVWKAARAVQGIVRLVAQPGPPAADATWQLLAAPSNPHPLADAVGEALPPAAALSSPASSLAAAGPSGWRPQALRMPEHGPCVVGAVLDR